MAMELQREARNEKALMTSTNYLRHVATCIFIYASSERTSRTFTASKNSADFEKERHQIQSEMSTLNHTHCNAQEVPDH